jgi:predicted MFS family arabinose efflux permease
MGIKQVGVPLGGIAAAGNGALSAVVPWQYLMLGVVGLIVVSGILCLSLARLPGAAGRGRGNPLANVVEVMKDWNHNRFVLANGLHNFGQTNFFAFLTLFLREAAAASQPVASLAVGVAQAASAIGRVGWGVVSDYLFRGCRKALVVGMSAVAVASFALMLAVGPGWGVWLGLSLAFVLGATIASAAPLLQTLTVEATEPRLAGSAMGVNMVCVHIGGMVGPPVFGFAVERLGGYAAGWALTAAAVLLGTAIFALWFKERRPG